MRRVSLVVPVLALALGWSGGTQAFAQGTKTARGTVTAMAGDSITVKVKNQDMKFSVDDKTEVIAPGGSHKTAAAQKAGASGAKLGEVIKTGQDVEVQYHDMGGTMHAASIRAIASAGGGSMSSDKPSTMHATGTVKSVTADSVVVTGSDGKDMTFGVDAKTTIEGTGLSHKSKSSGGKLSITDAIGMGDSVAVAYHDMGGSMHAADIRVTAKAKK